MLLRHDFYAIALQLREGLPNGHHWDGAPSNEVDIGLQRPAQANKLLLIMYKSLGNSDDF